MILDTGMDLLLTGIYATIPWIVGCRLVRLVRGESSWLSRSLAALLFATSLIVALVLMLGLAGLLTRGWMAAALIVVCIAVLWATRRTGDREFEVSESNDAGGWRAALAKFSPLQTIAVSFAFAVAAQIVLSMAVSAFREPPLAYDALFYHLVFPAEWIQQQRLCLSPTYFAAPANSYFPSHVEATFAYLMLMTGDDRLVNLSQLPFLLAGAAALAGIARRMKIAWPGALLAAAIYLGTPELAHQAGSALVDVDLAAFFLMALYFLLEYRESGNRSFAVIAGLAIGLLCGTKSVGLPFSIFLVPILVWAAAAKVRRGGAIIGDLAVLAVSLFPLGSFWYLRNWFVAGNPMFPLEIALGDRVVFAGAHGRKEMTESRFHIEADEAIDYALTRLWNPTLNILVLVAFAAIVISLLRERKLRDSLPFALHLLAIGIVLVEFFAHAVPYNTMFRFLFPAFGLSMLVFALATEIPRKLGSLFALLAAAILPVLLWRWESRPGIGVVKEAARLQPLMISSVAAVVALGVFFLLRRSGTPGPGKSRTSRYSEFLHPVIFAACIALLVLIQPLTANSYLDHSSESGTGKRAFVWAALMKETKPRVIAYTGMNQPYPLYGHDLRNTVRYVAIDGRQQWNLHDYLEIVGEESGPRMRRSYKPAYYRQQPDVDAWLSGLEAIGAELLVVFKFSAVYQAEIDHDGKYFPVEAEWAHSRPDRFELELRTDIARVYKILPPAPAVDPLIQLDESPKVIR